MKRNIIDVITKGLDPLDLVYRERVARIKQRKVDPTKKMAAFEPLFDVVLRQQAEIQALWALVERVARAADVQISHDLPSIVTDEEPEGEEEDGDSWDRI